jgi:S1-C subfamily serine protease
MNALKLLLCVAICAAGISVVSDTRADDTKAKVDATQTESESDSNTATSENGDNHAKQATLGIGVEPLPSVLTSHLPEVIGEGRGVLVADVTDDSPAAKGRASQTRRIGPLRRPRLVFPRAARQASAQ